MFDDSVFEGDTIRANDVGINDEIVFGFGITNGHGLIPDHFAIRWFVVHAGDDGGE